MENNTKTIKVNCGFSISGLGILLTAIFAILKGCGVITWTWLQVCIPVIVVGCLWGLGIILLLVSMLILYLLDR